MPRARSYPAGWQRRSYRIDPDSRATAACFAACLGLTLDAACRLAIYRYATARGVDLPGWLPPEAAKVQAFYAEADPPDGWWPRIAIRMPVAWPPAIEALYHGEVDSLAAVIRESLRALTHMTKEEWCAELADHKGLAP